MKEVFVEDIKERDRIDTAFLVTKKEKGVGKSGKPYLSLRLRDRTGELEARVWDNAEALGRNFEKDDVVSVKGIAISYQGRIQINVSEIRPLPEGEYSLSDFLPSSGRDAAQMMAELDGVIAGLRDGHLRALLTGIFADREVRERFKIAPAAKSMHHPYLGGLLEHVLSLCRLGDFVAAHYKGVNRDLLVAGLILHDIGKIFELRYSRTFGYTDEGRLIGHITMGADLVDAKIRELQGFPQELRMLLKHIILSHHGQLEYGSPKRPKTLEALIISYLDDLDAKVNAVQSLVEKDGGEGKWTEYQRHFERYIYKGRYQMEEAGEEDDADGEEEWGKGKELELFSNKA